ncbi:MAG: serine hydrolase [Thiotrichales bacterium]|nr:MAG: serine hydrolase [Thiotrichales bacterium]
MNKAALTILYLAILAGQAAHAKTEELIDAIVLDEMARQNIVGMAAGVIKNGELVYAKGYGHTDLARSRPVTTDTIFRWGSVSKTLTATAALMLAEEHPAFDLNDRVTEHVAYWPRQGNKGDIRIRHLLSNRSGVIHYKKKKHCPDNRKPRYHRGRHSSKYYDAEQAVNVFKHEPLCFDPGSHYKYSTFGYSLLGAAIEGASGTSYANWIDRKIGMPLGMTSLRQATGTSTGFDQHCHILRKVVSGNAAWKLPGGGWESNIIDLARFANGLLREDLLIDTHRLWTSVPANPAYGYGIKYSPDRAEVWHEGKHDNSRALLYLYPGSHDRLGIVLMINGIHSKPKPIAHRLANLFGREHRISKAPVVKNCDSECAGRFAGLWHKTGKDVLLRRGYTHLNFHAEWKFLRKLGYYSDDFEPRVEDGKVYWDAIFRKGSIDNTMLHETDHQAFRQKWNDLSRQGYRLVDLETFTIDGRRHWAGLFVQGSGKHAIVGELKTKDFATMHETLAHLGYKLIDIEPYHSAGVLYWAGAWTSGDDVLLNYNLSTNELALLRDRRLRSGFELTDIETYRHRGRQRWAGIWKKNSRGEKLSINQPFCGSKTGPNHRRFKGITHRHNEWHERGYELTDWERY